MPHRLRVVCASQPTPGEKRGKKTAFSGFRARRSARLAEFDRIAREDEEYLKKTVQDALSSAKGALDRDSLDDQAIDVIFEPTEEEKKEPPSR